MSIHRLRYLPSLLALLALGIATALIYLAAIGSLAALPLEGWAIVGGVVYGVASLGAWTLWQFAYTTVDEDGIRGWTILNTRKRIRWDEIGEGGIVPVPVFPFARIKSSQGGLAIWQPLQLSDPQRFAHAVSEAAGPDHPLARFLDPGE